MYQCFMHYGQLNFKTHAHALLHITSLSTRTYFNWFFISYFFTYSINCKLISLLTDFGVFDKFEYDTCVVLPCGRQTWCFLHFHCKKKWILCTTNDENLEKLVSYQAIGWRWISAPHALKMQTICHIVRILGTNTFLHRNDPNHRHCVAVNFHRASPFKVKYPSFLCGAKCTKCICIQHANALQCQLTVL